MAGPATIHQRITDEYGVTDNLPCADSTLLVALKRSHEYRLIRRKVIDRLPVDSWLDDGFHFFVFALLAHASADTSAELPLAVFAMHPESADPVSAVVVTPSPSGTQAEVMDLRQPDQTYIAPLGT